MVKSSETERPEISVESDLKQCMVETMEAEQRSKLLQTLWKKGLTTREVGDFVKGQGKTKRMPKAKNMQKSGVNFMKEKVRDSRKEEEKFRKERTKLRESLEVAVGTSKYRKIISRIKRKVERIKKKIQLKNKRKIKKYQKEKDKADLDEISSHAEELGEFANLRVFNNKEIIPEEPKPPMVASKDIVLSEDEMAILKRGPKFTLRNVLSKEVYMREVEKGLVKKKIGDIGKEEVDGKVVEDEFENEEDKKVAEYSEWLEAKSTCIYDFENKNINFGRSRATNWKGNKRIKLPKAGSTQLESYLDVRRRDAEKIYDECMELLKDGKEKVSHNNLTASEARGLKSLKKRVSDQELIICQTDKSSKFCVLTREQYLRAGHKHTSKDRKITREEHEEIQRCLNGHTDWWSMIWGLGSEWNQEDRSRKNLLNHGLSVCPLTLMIKDHKIWSLETEDPPSRPVMGGNAGGNVGISEFVSLALEPVADEMEGKVEINATSGLLNDIEELNEEIATEMKSKLVTSSPEEDLIQNTSDLPAGKEHGNIQAEKVEETPNQLEEENSEAEQTTPKEGSNPQEDPTNRQVKKGVSNHEGDIRFYLQKGKRGFTQDTLRTSENVTILKEDSEPIDKMKNLRDKMTASRKRKDRQEIQDATVIRRRKTMPKTWRGEKIIYASEVTSSQIQEELDLVIIGSDVQALYPSLTDVEVGIICYQAVMDSKVKFQNINFKKASQYIAMCLSKEEQLVSPLRRILPTRTSRGGVRPGVTANPEKEDCFEIRIYSS